tara:strand:- start:106 stop:456 length:351 start_codon:yes stop_codon:yes gene_type:complete
MTTQALADVKGLVCVDNDNYYIFYLIDVDREKISYTNQSQEAWSSTKLVKSSLTILKWKEGTIPVWTINLHREKLIMMKRESSGKSLEFQCSVRTRDETIEGHELATEEQRKRNKI